MKLRTRLASILGGFTVVLIALSVAVTQAVVVRRALRLDRQSALAAHDRARRRLTADVDRLQLTAQAWAARAAALHEATLPAQAAPGAPPLALFLDAQGRPLHAPEPDAAVSRALAAAAPGDGFDRRLAGGAAGYLAVAGRVWLIAVAPLPVAAGDGSEVATPATLLLLGRPVGDAFGGSGTHPDAAVAGELLAASPHGGDEDVRASDLRTLTCFSLLADWRGEPTLALRTRVPRAAFRQALISLVYLAGWMLACGVAVTGFAFWTLDRWVLRSVTLSARTLRAGIAALAQTGEERPRLKGIEPGEMGELAFAINAMLDAFDQSEREAARRRAEAVQAQKLAALGTLVAGVAHEVNNPNGIVSLNMHVLRRLLDRLFESLHSCGSTPGPGAAALREQARELQETVAETLDASKRIAAFVTSLRNYAQPSAERLTERVDLNATARNACEWVRHELDSRRCRLELALAADLPAIRGNGMQLQQVLVNLLQNACQATTQAGAVIEVVSALAASRQALTLSVRDTGRGIRPEELERVMDPFFTTRRGEGGCGLGLSISAAIVKAHGGTLTLTSSPGAGTTVRVTLPLQGDNDHDAP